MTQDIDPNVEVPLAVVGKEEVERLQETKKRIDDVMDIVKEHGLDKDDEFMKEIQEAVDASLKD